jgi:nucleolar complex protein 2
MISRSRFLLDRQSSAGPRLKSTHDRDRVSLFRFTKIQQEALVVKKFLFFEDWTYFTMVKQSKRARKFATSGGVKARLEKGTIAKKGKIRNTNKRPNKNSDDGPPTSQKDSYSQELRQKREELDFVSQKNLGDLDMDSFFTTFADDADAVDVDEQEMEENNDNESEEEDAEGSDDEEVEPKKSKKAKQVTKKKEESDSESDEEDVEAVERQMKEEMGKLQKNDPEFHQFLQENEDSLLEYGNEGGDDDDEEMGDEDRSDQKMDTSEQEQPPVEETTISMTPSLLEKLEKGTFKMHGIKALKKLVNAFKSACHLADADQDENKSRDKKYEIESSEVFDRLMVLSLTRLHEEFHYHLRLKESTEETEKDDDEDDGTVDPNKPINPKLLEKSPRWVDIKPILFTFLKASMHILSEAKEPDLVVFVLKSLAIYIPYMTPFPRIAESMLKTLTALWSAPIDSSEDYQVVRLHAFLRIRQLAMTQPFPFIEEGLKKLYLAYAQRAKFATASSVSSALPTLTFMGNCVVELYSLDYHSAYQHAFIYIRQLALHLRTAMHKKTPEALSAVYCWQYLHCLKLWVAVLTEACQGEEGAGASGEEQLLRSLLFPLSQVILGTVRLIPSTRYLPLRLHCVRLLQQLAAAAEIFLPTTSILLDVFDLRELSQPPKKINKSNVQPLAITLKLRADNPLRTMEELEMCISEVFILLNREIDLYQYSAGFPEFSVRICQRLRKVRMVAAVTLLRIFVLKSYTFFRYFLSFRRKPDLPDGELTPKDVWICATVTPSEPCKSVPS